MEKVELLVRSFVESNPRDAAQSSSIFLTTVTDCVGFASFLGFAVLFMPLLVG